MPRTYSKLSFDSRGINDSAPASPSFGSRLLTIPTHLVGNPDVAALCRQIEALPQIMAALDSAEASLDWARQVISDIPTQSKFMSTLHDVRSAFDTGKI